MRKKCREISVLLSIGVTLFTAALLVGQQPLIIAEPAPSTEPVVIIRTDTLAWTSAPSILPKGANMAVLSGDPTKPGPFVIRLRFPPGYRIPAHTSAMDKYITVISGSFNVGMGDRFDMSEGKAMPAGSFIRLPARMSHYAWAASDTVVQLHGMGPFDIQYLERSEDPRTSSGAYVK
jgi:quercetin dioxygenase-like cupin family protein